MRFEMFARGSVPSSQSYTAFLVTPKSCAILVIESPSSFCTKSIWVLNEIAFDFSFSVVLGCTIETMFLSKVLASTMMINGLRDFRMPVLPSDKQSRSRAPMLT
ncbi:hypothetical protein D3C76_1452390 [compost metagenome]